MNREHSERVFTTICTDPSSWHWHARDLLRAASIVWNAHEPAQAEANRRAGTGESLIGCAATLWMPYSVLAGLAVECAVKTCWAAAGRIVVKGGEMQRFRSSAGKVINGHDIVGLAAEVGLVFAGIDHQLCAALSDCVQWGGKYPTALRADAPGIPMAIVTPDGLRHLVTHEAVTRVFTQSSERAAVLIAEQAASAADEDAK